LDFRILVAFSITRDSAVECVIYPCRHVFRISRIHTLNRIEHPHYIDISNPLKMYMKWPKFGSVVSQKPRGRKPGCMTYRKSASSLVGSIVTVLAIVCRQLYIRNCPALHLSRALLFRLSFPFIVGINRDTGFSSPLPSFLVIDT